MRAKSNPLLPRRQGRGDGRTAATRAENIRPKPWSRAAGDYTWRMQATLNAMIPVVIAATFLVLCVGIFALFRGGRFNRSYSNLLMRWRILLQFIAICLIAVASLLMRR